MPQTGALQENFLGKDTGKIASGISMKDCKINA